MIKNVKIYGERCSGTNYLEKLLLLNFDINIVLTYGWKHFFGFNDLSNTDDILFIGIVRNLPDWVNSLYRERYHLPQKLTKDIDTFLNETFYSINKNKNNDEIMGDRNIETKERYKNIFELRHIKNKFLVETMPTLVKNYCLITHDDLVNDFINIMTKIKSFNLQVNNNIEFPLNITYNIKNNKKKTFEKKPNEINDDMIIKKADLFYEKILFPKLFNM